MEQKTIIARFLSKLAHDIRNSSGLISINLDLIERQTDPTYLRECFADCKEAVDRLNAFASGLSATFNMGDVESSRVRWLELSEHALQSVHQARQKECAPPMEVTVEVKGESSIEIESSAPALERAVGCILMNAYDALEARPPDTPTIRITVRPGLCEISNNGPPIPSDLPIFGPFVSHTSHERFRAGLGLVTAQTYAEKLGLRLRLANSDSEWTTFAFEW